METLMMLDLSPLLVPQPLVSQSLPYPGMVSMSFSLDSLPGDMVITL